MVTGSVKVGQPATLDFTQEVGALSEAVTLAALAPGVQPQGGFVL